MVATQVRAHSTAPARLIGGVLGDADIIAVKPSAADVRIKLPLGPGPGITGALAGAEAAGLGPWRQREPAPYQIVEPRAADGRKERAD
jgi:hypothetical protein